MGKGKKLPFDKIEELYGVFTETLKVFEPKNDHEELLFAHVKSYHHKLKVMVAKEQNTYTLTMSETEAVFFRQVWQYVQVKTSLYRAEIARNMIEVADQFIMFQKNRKQKY